MRLNLLSRLLHRAAKDSRRPGAQRGMARLEKEIGYKFKRRDLLNHALKHRSVLSSTGESRRVTNERLEFLGDAVLDLVIREDLLERYPKAREGQLTRFKSNLVSGRQLARIARGMELGAYLQISAGEARTGGRTRSSILEDALEALIGAIYLDGGLPSARRFILRFISNSVKHGRETERDHNYKSLLLEKVQARGFGHPIYEVIEEKGPDHSKMFVVEVLVDGIAYGRGDGRSKKIAEQKAAKKALGTFSGEQTELNDNSAAGSNSKPRVQDS